MAKQQPYVAGAPLSGALDLPRELRRVQQALLGRVRYRGKFSPTAAARLDPAPDVGDLWVVEDPAAALRRCYLQLSVRPRERVWWDCTAEPG